MSRRRMLTRNRGRGLFGATQQFLGKLERGFTVEVSIPLDAESYFDRQCPHQACGGIFKVQHDDWESKVGETATCPLCGHRAPNSPDWYTEEQREQLDEAAAREADVMLHSALRADGRASRTRPRGNLLSVGLSVTSSRPPAVPMEPSEVMRKKWLCERCSCRYASVGAAYYCPACGHLSPAQRWDTSIEHLRRVLGDAEGFRAALLERFDEDTAQVIVQRMLEDSIKNLVGDFEAFSLLAFAAQPAAAGMRVGKGDFQRLRDVNDRWRAIGHRGYDDILGAADYADLVLLYQKRHVLTHSGGQVDQAYVDKTGDATYAVGQRIVVRHADVLRLADLLDRLASEIKAHL